MRDSHSRPATRMVLIALMQLLWVVSEVVVNAGADELQPLDSRVPNEQVEFEGGWFRDHRNANDDAFYYRLQYRGRRIRTEGSPFAIPSDEVAPSARLQDPAGDSEGFIARLERGRFGTGGDLFELFGVRPLTFVVPSLARLRGTAQISGQLEGDDVTYALGVETPPFHPLRTLNERLALNATNWIIFGVQGERRHRDSTSSELTDSGVLTARAFVGRGFLCGHSRRLTGVNRDLVRDAMAVARNFEEAKVLLPKLIAKVHDETISAPEKLVYTIAEEGDHLKPEEQRDARIWERHVTVAATENLELSPRDTARLLFWIEGSAWREIGRNPSTNAWLNRLVLAVRFAPLAKDADAFWLSVRYVNGFERFAPSSRLNQLVAVVGIKL